MPDEPREPGSPIEAEIEPEEGDEEQSTPFDHPYFLPVLLTGFALWFGYDGFFNKDMEWVKFNRYGFAILAVAAIYYTVRAIREQRAVRVWTCAACGRENPPGRSDCPECGSAASPSA